MGVRRTRRQLHAAGGPAGLGAPRRHAGRRPAGSRSGRPRDPTYRRRGCGRRPLRRTAGPLAEQQLETAPVELTAWKFMKHLAAEVGVHGRAVCSPPVPPSWSFRVDSPTHGRTGPSFAGVVPPGRADPSRRGLLAGADRAVPRADRAARPELNAFRMVPGERALVDAHQADARRAAGDDRPLLGVPIAVKDTEDLAGEVRPGARPTSRAGPARQRARARLRAAGAVILGKTNLPELAIMGDTEGPRSGSPATPGTPIRTPGGSSGGSAAAVAAGLCAAATASDGAGSIRIPAAAAASSGSSPRAT